MAYRIRRILWKKVLTTFYLAIYLPNFQKYKLQALFGKKGGPANGEERWTREKGYVEQWPRIPGQLLDPLLKARGAYPRAIWFIV